MWLINHPKKSITCSLWNSYDWFYSILFFVNDFFVIDKKNQSFKINHKKNQPKKKINHNMQTKNQSQKNQSTAGHLFMGLKRSQEIRPLP